MEKDKNEGLIEIEKTIGEMPEKKQKAIYWILSEWEVVEKICKSSKMTNEEIENYKKKAREKEDYTMLGLLCAAQAYRDGTVKQTDQPSKKKTVP